MDNILLSVAEWIGAVAVVMIAGTSQRFKRIKLVFMFPRREGIVSLAVYAFAMLTAVLLTALPSFSILGINYQLSARLFLAVAGLVPVGVALFRRKQPVRSAGWSRDKLSPSLQLGLALAFLTIFLRGKFTPIVTGLDNNEISLLAYYLVVVLLEETTFRGFIQQRMAAWLGPTFGWLVSALMFVLWQLPRLLTSPADQLWLNLGVAVAQSLVAGFIMQRSGHVLAPALYRAISEWLFFVK
jgi:membrane protease YdiL (CAAX protease family)